MEKSVYSAVLTPFKKDLSIDTKLFIQSKDEWIEFCKSKNIELFVFQGYHIDWNVEQKNILNFQI